jgi:hypothetical protein
MRKHFLVLFFFTVTVSLAAFSQWTNVGQPGFSNAWIDYTFISSDLNGRPCVVFRDLGVGGKATVMRYNGATWCCIGNRGFSSGDAHNTQLVFDKNGIPYVVYTDWANDKKATVMRFDGVNWNIVGNSGFSPGAATYTTISIDSLNFPYVAFRDAFHNSCASVMKFDGANWVYVGMPGFSAIGTGVQGASQISLKIAANNKPIIGYVDNSNGYRASVMGFNGTDWRYVGCAGFSPWQVAYTSLALDNNGTPYIAYSDRANGDNASVMKYNGTVWVPVGNLGFTPGAASFTSLQFYSGTPYIAYSDYSFGRMASVMKFNGANWIQVGTAAFSNSDVFDVSLAINQSGQLYVAYVDQSIGYGESTVMTFEISTGNPEALFNLSSLIAPNPSPGTFYLSGNYQGEQEVFLTILNLLGKTIHSRKIEVISGQLNTEIDLSTQPKGIYFLELIAGNRRETKKIIVE